MNNFYIIPKSSCVSINSFLRYSFILSFDKLRNQAPARVEKSECVRARVHEFDSIFVDSQKLARCLFYCDRKGYAPIVSNG